MRCEKISPCNYKLQILLLVRGCVWKGEGAEGREGNFSRWEASNDKLPQAVCNSSYVPLTWYMASAQNGVIWQPTKSCTHTTKYTHAHTLQHTPTELNTTTKMGCLIQEASQNLSHVTHTSYEGVECVCVCVAVVGGLFLKLFAIQKRVCLT